MRHWLMAVLRKSCYEGDGRKRESRDTSWLATPFELVVGAVLGVDNCLLDWPAFAPRL